MKFIPLAIRSSFAYLQSALTPEKIASFCQKNHFFGGAIADIDTLAGYAPFYHAMKEKNVVPIFGANFSFFPELYLYVENEKGYQNLLLLEEKRNNKTLKIDDFFKTNEGLLAVLILKDGILYEETLYQKLSKAYPHFYLGLTQDYSENYVDKMRTFAKNHQIKILAFPLIYYPKEEDAIALEIVKAIRDKTLLTKKEEKGRYFFPNEESLQKSYQKEEIENTYEVFTYCSSFQYIHKRGTLLSFREAKDMGADTYLKEKALEGLKNKGKLEERYQKRLDDELRIISKMGFSDYFLIVGDYVNYAKRKGILVGPGRGSAGGSLVAYALDIVSPDPLEFGLLFERFLNPERQNLPDIDVDFEDTRREEIVTYLKEKYGEERCAHVLTTQTIGAKEALRDIGRVYEYPIRDIDYLCRSIKKEKDSLRKNYKEDADFRKIIDSDKYYLEIVSLASKIEGLPRQSGIHAAGVLLNEEPLAHVLPIEKEEVNGQVAQLEKDYLEEQGFLKMDILSIRNLSILRNILRNIEEETKEKISYESIPVRDQEAIELIAKGETMGFFQIESAWMRRVIAQIKPERLEDIAALEALGRPGPAEQIPHYAARKRGKEKVSYFIPELEPILKETYGIIVYQEQIMEICRKIASMSYGEADLFRRAISKKDKSRLDRLKPLFIRGVLKNGKKKEEAEKLYSLIESFANYGFNKSHAIAYAYLTMKMAYLKAHYPKAFYAAIFDSLSSSDEKFRNVLSEMKKRKIELLLPSLNASEVSYHVEKEGIRAPLSFIRGLPSSLTHDILDERLKNGPYKDYFDFARRGKPLGLTLPYFIRLIDGGALDIFPENRASKRATAYAALNYASMFVGKDGQPVLFDFDIETPIFQKRDESLLTKLEAEKEALGIMLSGSPLKAFEKMAKRLGAIPLSEIDTANSPFHTYGLIKSMTVKTSKKGTRYVKLDLMDETAEVTFTLWNDVYSKNYASLKNDRVILVAARRNYHLNTLSYVVTDVTPLLEEDTYEGNYH